jgi:hypothetical protein
MDYVFIAFVIWIALLALTIATYFIRCCFKERRQGEHASFQRNESVYSTTASAISALKQQLWNTTYYVLLLFSGIYAIRIPLRTLFPAWFPLMLIGVICLIAALWLLPKFQADIWGERQLMLRNDPTYCFNSCEYCRCKDLFFLILFAGTNAAAATLIFFLLLDP